MYIQSYNPLLGWLYLLLDEGFDNEDFEELEPEILTLDVGRKFEKTKNFQKYKDAIEQLFDERKEITLTVNCSKKAQHIYECRILATQNN